MILLTKYRDKVVYTMLSLWIWLQDLISFLKNPAKIIIWRDLWNKLLLGICAVKSRIILDPREKRRLLEWVASNISRVKPPNDFSNSWKDGIVLCAVVEGIVKGSCPRYDLLNPEQGASNLELGLHLIEKNIGIKPGLTVDDFLHCDSTTERKLICLISQLKLASAKLRLKSVIHRPVIRLNAVTAIGAEQECIAKGMGLMLAVKGRKARFSIFLKKSCMMNIVVEIRGPENTVCSERITNRSPKRIKSIKTVDADEKGKKIPFEFVIQSGKISVSYIPLVNGQHKLSIIWQGQHIMGSPYYVTVDDSINIEAIKPQENKRFLVHRQKTSQLLDSASNKCKSCGKVDSVFNANSRNLGNVTKKRVLCHFVMVDGKEIVIKDSNPEKLAKAIKNVMDETNDNDDQNRCDNSVIIKESLSSFSDIVESYTEVINKSPCADISSLNKEQPEYCESNLNNNELSKETGTESNGTCQTENTKIKIELPKIEICDIDKEEDSNLVSEFSTDNDGLVLNLIEKPNLDETIMTECSEPCDTTSQSETMKENNQATQEIHKNITSTCPVNGNDDDDDVNVEDNNETYLEPIEDVSHESELKHQFSECNINLLPSSSLNVSKSDEEQNYNEENTPTILSDVIMQPDVEDVSSRTFEEELQPLPEKTELRVMIRNKTKTEEDNLDVNKRFGQYFGDVPFLEDFFQPKPKIEETGSSDCLVRLDEDNNILTSNECAEVFPKHQEDVIETKNENQEILDSDISVEIINDNQLIRLDSNEINNPDYSTASNIQEDYQEDIVKNCIRLWENVNFDEGSKEEQSYQLKTLEEDSMTSKSDLEEEITSLSTIVQSKKEYWEKKVEEKVPIRIKKTQRSRGDRVKKLKCFWQNIGEDSYVQSEDDVNDVTIKYRRQQTLEEEKERDFDYPNRISV